jgi:hypothetical protein
MANTAVFRKTLTDPTPLYAAAGAGDLAVEKIRELPGRLAGLRDFKVDFKVEPKAVQDKVQERLADLQVEVRRLPDLANTAVSDGLAQASKTYGELAERGRSVVDRIRSQKATQELIEQAEATVAKARAARKTATAGAKGTGRAVKKTAAEAAKTVDAAGEAVESAADEFGK